MILILDTILAICLLCLPPFFVFSVFWWIRGQVEPVYGGYTFSMLVCDVLMGFFIIAIVAGEIRWVLHI